MKTKIAFIFLFIVCNTGFSQENTTKTNGNNRVIIDPVESGKIENGVYTCNLFDWKIAIPENYKITEKKEPKN